MVNLKKVIVKTFTYFVIIFFASITTFASADEKYYGSFIYNSDIPNALFFIDAIKPADSFELRKALRNHPIDTLVLASPGGSVWEGLSMAGIIFDRNLRVFVPENALCASACSFIFFGGGERLSDGKLGVHQFATSGGGKLANENQTQAESQFTVSEIIGFLNEFNTPRFVFERMFEDREMYWFNQGEKSRLNSQEFTLDDVVKEKLVNFYSVKSASYNAANQSNPKQSNSSSSLTKEQLVTLIQKGLNEVGCNVGAADGIWGNKTQDGAMRFAKKAGLSTSIDNLLSVDFVKALEKAPAGFCPKPKSIKLKRFLSVYNITCDGQVVTSSPWKIMHNQKDKIIAITFNNNTTEQFSYKGRELYLVPGFEPGKIFLNGNGDVYKFEFRNKNCNKLIALAR